MTTRGIVVETSTRRRIAELEISGLTFGRKLCAPGPVKGTATLPELDSLAAIAQARAINDALDPLRRALVIDRDGTAVWAGPIWGDNSTGPGGRQLSFDGTEWSSMFSRRFIDWTAAYTATDRFDLLRDLLTTLTARAGGDLGITVTTNDSGVTDTRTWLAWERPRFGEIFDELAGLEDGFEWTLDPDWVDDELVLTLRLTQGRRGRSFHDTGLVFEYGGNVTDIGRKRDGTRIANQLHGMGATQGGQTSPVTVADTSQLTPSTQGGPGYPLAEDRVSFPQETDQARLRSLTSAQLAGRSTVNEFITVTVRADAVPKLGFYECGDTVRVISQPGEHPLWPDGLDRYQRIIAYDVTVSDTDPSGASDTVDVTLGEAA